MKIEKCLLTMCLTLVLSSSIDAANESYHMPRTAMSAAVIRNYKQPVTAEEKDKIRYILTSMARKSWTQLLKSRSSLKKAGDSINHIHPLRFLMTAFSDEELKASLQAMRDSWLIWGEYTSGLFGSLDEESNKNNITQEFVKDFAKQLNIDYTVILPSIQNRRWSKFVDQLIELLPRKGNPGRYDM